MGSSISGSCLAEAPALQQWEEQNRQSGQLPTCLGRPGGATLDEARVVIIGGGYAGLAVAGLLDRHLQVTLLERKDVFVHCIAGLRALASEQQEDEEEGSSPEAAAAAASGASHGGIGERRGAVDLERDVLLRYPRRLPSGGLQLRGEAESVDVAKGEVLARLQSAKPQDPPARLPFDFLVLAIGRSQSVLGRGGACTSRDEVAVHFWEMRQRIRRARRVLVVGGGAVGVELAAEIRHHHQQQQCRRPGEGQLEAASVTLVHAHAGLCNRLAAAGLLSAAVQAQLANRLSAMGVQLRLSCKAILPKQQGAQLWLEGERRVSLSDGSGVQADLVLLATGPPPPGPSSTNKGLLTSLLAPQGGGAIDQAASAAAASGRVPVNDRLQVAGHGGKVFALGDVAEAEGSGLALAAMQQARVVAGNILALARSLAQGGTSDEQRAAPLAPTKQASAAAPQKRGSQQPQKSPPLVEDANGPLQQPPFRWSREEWHSRALLLSLGPDGGVGCASESAAPGKPPVVLPAPAVIALKSQGLWRDRASDLVKKGRP